MDISVVIPTFNRADLLPLTLDAVLAQTLRAREIIVVDDGSVDNTAEVLAAYAPRIRSIKIPNSGELVTRNTGLRAATGDLVAFCDSDDIWRPEFLATMAGLWRAEPDIRVGYCNFVLIRDGEWQDHAKFADAPDGFWQGLRPLGGDMAVFDQPIIENLLRFQPFFPSTMVVDRRSFAETGGWDESVSGLVGCDFATTLRVAAHASIGVVRKPLVGIRKHSGNFSADVQKMNLGDSLVLEKVMASSATLADYAEPVRKTIQERRRAALAAAFVRHDLAAVQSIYALLPAPARTGAVNLKQRIARLPQPFSQLAMEIMLAAGSLKSSLLKPFEVPLRRV